MDPVPTNDAVRLYREMVLDGDLGGLRVQFCRTATNSLASVASWLGVDSFLGGGDWDDLAPSRETDPDPERYVAFRATAAVIEMASELATGAVALLDHQQRFASSALIRQLIETEYLLKAFSLDFSDAARWAGSTPEEVRRSFSPKTMRSIGGFSNREYWHHSDMGGHPAPSGRRLLRFNLAVSPAEDDFLTASVWGDLAQHLRRLWATVDELLQEQHARYDRVRASEHEQVRRAEEEWMDAGPLAEPVDFRLWSVIAAEIMEGE